LGSSHKTRLSLWFVKLTYDKVEAAYDQARKTSVAKAWYALPLTGPTKLSQGRKGSFLPNQNQQLVSIQIKLSLFQHLP